MRPEASRSSQSVGEVTGLLEGGTDIIVVETKRKRESGEVGIQPSEDVTLRLVSHYEPGG